MFSYITDLHTVETTGTNVIEVDGHDMQSLLYNYMDEFLFQFCTEGFVARRVEILSLDREAFTITARGHGEKFQVRTRSPSMPVLAVVVLAPHPSLPPPPCVCVCVCVCVRACVESIV